MEINIKALIQAADEMREALPIVARQLRAYFNELTEAGFTEEQALKITITHGLTPGSTGPSRGE